MEFELTAFNRNIHGLRGLAAIAVVILHLFHHIQMLSVIFPIFNENILVFLEKYISAFSSGVEFFFMISGYLITASLLRHKNIGVFFIDRAIRIYPVFLFIHIPFFLVMPFYEWKWLADVTFIEWVGHFLSNMFFLPGIFDLPLVQSQAWTLSYELLFYLLSSLIYFLSIKVKIKTKYRLLLFVVILLPIFIVYPRGLYFLIGVLVFLLLKTYPTWFNHKRFYPTLCFLLILTMLGPLDYGVETSRAAIHADDLMTKLALLPAFLFFIGITRSQGFISKFLRTKTMQFLGTISYSLYLWHGVVLFIYSHFLVNYVVNQLSMNSVFGFILLHVIFIILAICTSWISYYLLEYKLCRVLKEYKSKHLNKGEFYIQKNDDVVVNKSYVL